MLKITQYCDENLVFFSLIERSTVISCHEQVIIDLITIGDEGKFTVILHDEFKNALEFETSLNGIPFILKSFIVNNDYPIMECYGYCYRYIITKE